MKYIVTPAVGLFLTLVSAFVAPIGMLFAVWFIRWDALPSEAVTRWSTGPGDPNDTMMVLRGHFPKWLAWFGVPDDLPPGNVYVPEVRELLLRRGSRLTSYVFFGWRNQLMNLAAACGKPATDYIPEVFGFWQRDDIWCFARPLGPFRFVAGWQVYKSGDAFWAVPVFSVKRC